MSQDKFWEQWTSETGKPEERPKEGEKPAEPGATVAGVDADVLAAWLKALPPTDVLVPSTTPPPPSTPANPADLADLWPPAAPVDPFVGIHAAASGSTTTDWDLSFDPVPPIPPSGTVEPPAPEVAAGPAPPVEVPVPPVAPVSPLGDFTLDLGGLGSPPPPSPFATPTAPTENAAPPAEAPAPPVSPFGPPPPPVAPPAEALQAAPLKLEITVGRLTSEQIVRGEALLGRPDTTRGVHPEIDLRHDDAVSRRHAKIFVRNGAYVLTDLNSTNGTRYNREFLQPEAEVVLKPGDEIEVGAVTRIRVLEVPPPHA